jgi:hypothetical protein
MSLFLRTAIAVTIKAIIPAIAAIPCHCGIDRKSGDSLGVCVDVGLLVASGFDDTQGLLVFLRCNGGLFQVLLDI